jgi:hypothetical protein
MLSRLTTAKAFAESYSSCVSRDIGVGLCPNISVSFRYQGATNVQYSRATAHASQHDLGPQLVLHFLPGT